MKIELTLSLNEAVVLMHIINNSKYMQLREKILEAVNEGLSAGELKDYKDNVLFYMKDRTNRSV